MMLLKASFYTKTLLQRHKTAHKLLLGRGVNLLAKCQVAGKKGASFRRQGSKSAR